MADAETKEVIKKRVLDIEGMSCSGCETSLEGMLSKISGVRSVEADAEKRKLNISYDLLTIRLADIQKKISELGYSVKDSFKLKILRATEKNEFDNIMAAPGGCAGCRACYSFDSDSPMERTIGNYK